MQSSESGRKLNQAVNTTSRAVGKNKILIYILFNYYIRNF